MVKNTGKTTKGTTETNKNRKLASSNAATSNRSASNPVQKKLKSKRQKISNDNSRGNRTKLPNVIELTKKSSILLWEYRKLFLGLTLVYGILNLLLVQGLASSTDVATLKSQTGHVLTGGLGSIVSGFSVFAVLVGSSNNGTTQAAGAYQLILAIITSLAVIWALRHVLNGKLVRIRDSYYKSMTPLVPFILILLVLIIQLLPLAIGSSIWGYAVGGGVAISILEKLAVGLISGVLALWSLYMLSASVFALYIVTLPDMTPLAALRSAREQVRGRRWTVLRKILALPFILMLGGSVIMLPFILILTPVAQWVFLALTMFSLVAVHTYMYILYRELISE